MTIAPGFGAHAAVQGWLPYPGVRTFLRGTYIYKQACVCVCVYRGDRYLCMGLDLYLIARIKLFKVAAM